MSDSVPAPRRPTWVWSLPSAGSLAVAAVVVLVMPRSLRAADWYVDEEADCISGDGRQASPFCRIQHAIDAATSGDTILIAPGVYFEYLTITRKDLTLIGTGGDEVTFVDGRRPSYWGQNDEDLIRTYQQSSVELVGLTVRRASRNGITHDGLHLTLNGCTLSENRRFGLENVAWDADVWLSDCSILDNATGLRIRRMEHVRLNRCAVQGNRGSGLVIDYGSGEITVTDSTVCGNGGYGILNHGSSRRTLVVRHSVVRGNGLVGISNYRHRVVLDHVEVSENGEGGVWNGGKTDAPGTMEIRSSTIAANTAQEGGGILNDLRGEGSTVSIGHTIVAGNSAATGPDCSGPIDSEGYNLIGDTRDCTVEGDETGNLYDIDPLFADHAAGDYSLQSISPCVEAGDVLLAPGGRDLGDNPRLLDGDLDRVMIVDLGAYECDNVHLTVTGDATPGGILTIETTGTPQLVALMFVGMSPGETMLAPYGSLLMSWPYYFFPFAVIPDAKDIAVPPSVPPGTSLLLQELAVNLYSGAGNFSNAVGVVIE